jgi:RsiW-degrading membrane proteinase PrsW (M82 family)
MDVLIIVAVAFAPGLFWLWYFFRKDKLHPEPLYLIRKCFVWGMAAIIPAGFLEVSFGFVSSFWQFVFVAPIIEELIKFWIVRGAVYENVEFDEPVDGIIYAAAAALGFATAENVLYLIQAYRTSAGAVATLAIIRAFLSVPGHALWSAMWGYALGFAKFSDAKRGRELIVRGFILAVVFHGAFNLVCLSGPLFAVGMLIVVPIFWSIANRRIHEALAASPLTNISTKARPPGPFDSPEGDSEKDEVS